MYQAPPPAGAPGRTCPACGRTAMPVFDRLFRLNVQYSYPCRSCGAALRLSRATALSVGITVGLLFASAGAAYGLLDLRGSVWFVGLMAANGLANLGIIYFLRHIVLAEGR